MPSCAQRILEELKALHSIENACVVGAGVGACGGTRSWLLHARYVRGEHAACAEIAEELHKKTNNTHRYAFFVQGLVLADAGRLQEALERFHSCIRLQPRNAEPLKHVAKCLFKQGRYQLALEAYIEVEKLSTKPEPEVFCCLAECAAKLGDPKRGSEWAQAAVGAGGGERAAALLAKLLLEQEEITGALAAYDTALASYSCSAETLAAAGALRLRAGDPRRAFQLLGAALALNPSHHPAGLALAAMMLEYRDVDAALSRLRTALTVHPGCVAAHSDLGLALLAKRKFVAAVTCLQRAASAAPLSARAAHNLGMAFLMGKRTASAFCRLAAAVALDPTNATTVMLLAIALERLGDTRADAAFIRAATMEPADALIRFNLAARHARAERFQDAAEESRVVAQILSTEDMPDSELASNLATLVALLRGAGVDIQKLEEPRVTAADDEYVRPSDDIDPDEVSATERNAHLLVLPPIIVGADDLDDALKVPPQAIENETKNDETEKHPQKLNAEVPMPSEDNDGTNITPSDMEMLSNKFSKHLSDEEWEQFSKILNKIFNHGSCTCLNTNGL